MIRAMMTLSAQSVAAKVSFSIASMAAAKMQKSVATTARGPVVVKSDKPRPSCRKCCVKLWKAVGVRREGRASRIRSSRNCLLADMAKTNLAEIEEAAMTDLAPTELLKLADELDRLREVERTTDDGEPDNAGDSWNEYAGHFVDHHAEITAALRQAASVERAEPQGLCDTTLTERFKNSNCRCATYPGNKGPCQRFEAGANGNCAYCDHERACHVVGERAEVAGEAVAWRYRWKNDPEASWDAVSDEAMLPTNREGWHIEPLGVLATPPRSEGVRGSEVQSESAIEALATRLREAAHYCTKLPELEYHCREVADELMRHQTEIVHDTDDGLPSADDVRGILAPAQASCDRGAQALRVVCQMVEAFDSGNLQMSSPEIGEPENDIPYHPWHDELLHHARLALEPATPSVPSAECK